MHSACELLHRVCRTLPTHRFPFDAETIPTNGIYLLFETGEEGHEGPRIVRVGTHTGGENLCKRLGEHFLTENKDRSIFRKHLGRAILRRDNDSFYRLWNLDLTSKANRERYANRVDFTRQAEIEAAVTKYIQTAFWFVAFALNDQLRRAEVEAKLIGTVSHCRHCGPSANWLGRFHPDSRIGTSGMWNIQGLKNPGFDDDSQQELEEIVRGGVKPKQAEPVAAADRRGISAF